VTYILVTPDRGKEVQIQLNDVIINCPMIDMVPLRYVRTSVGKSSIHLHYVLLGTLYRSALVTPGTLHHKPPRMGAHLFFIYFHYYHHQEDIYTILQFLKIKFFIPYLLFERFTLIIAPLMCTTKPPWIDSTTFFFNFVLLPLSRGHFSTQSSIKKF